MLRPAAIAPLFALSMTAIAGPAPAAAQDDAARARASFSHGVELFEQEEYTEALDAFRDAYRIRPHPSVLVNLATGGEVTVASERQATPTGTETGTEAETEGETATEAETAVETGAPDDRDILGLPLGTWVAGGASVAAFVTAIGFGAKALRQRDDFDALAQDIRSRPQSDPDLPQLRSDLRAIDDARRTNAIVADVMLGLGVVGAGLAVFFALTDEDPDDAGVHAGAAPLPGGGGAWLRADL